MARLRRWFALAVLVAALGGAAGLVVLDRRMRAYLAGPSLGGIRIYAAPSVLRPGAPVPGGSLGRKLTRLGYRTGDRDTPLVPGEFRVGAAMVELAQRPSPAPWADAPGHVRVTVRAGRVEEIRDLAGGRLPRLELEPELLAVLGGQGPTLEAAADVASPACRAAVLSAEDRHFFHHPGINPVAIVRALVADLRAQAPMQGGSTISQQLVKNAFLTPHRTIKRKVQEAVLALLLEARATKEEILGRYLASVYLGVDGGLPVHGFAQAAEVYFEKPIADLGVHECALLAGMIRSPNALAPRRHPRAAHARRNRVLTLMVRHGVLDAEAGARAMAAPLGVTPPRPRSVGALYVAAEVARSLAHLMPPEVAQAPGLAIFTAVDADAQRAAERAVRRGVDALERGRRRSARLQAALIALDAATGRVRALVGGRDYGSSPLDRAIKARRQPGSAFKPFVYLAAIDPARRGDRPAHTVVSMVDDLPVSLRSGGKLWKPANYDGTFAGPMTLEDALAASRNAAAVHLALDVGLDAIVQSATDLGIASPLPRVPALALGVAETTLLELTAAYGVFASGGVRRPPVLIVGVTSAAGETLYAEPPMEERVLTPGVAYLMTHLLENVVDEGTGRGAREAGLEGPAAGKTGTTDDTRDAWFIGFTPEVVAGVWVGFDKAGPTGFTGAQGALPIWTEFIRATAGPSPNGFPVPEDIVWRDVDPGSGELATAACPAQRREPFLTGTEPTRTCALHQPVWTAVGDQIGDAVRGGGRAIGSGRRRVRDWFGRLFR